jgi:ATP-dependent Clp protease, protease subunit
MMHQLSGGIGGTAADIAIQAESMLHIKQVMNERIAFHTGHTAEQIEIDADRDRWFTAQQAKEYGLVDHVISKATDANAVAALI